MSGDDQHTALDAPTDTAVGRPGAAGGAGDAASDPVERPSWWVCIASAAPVVGIMATLFPIAPLWTVAWFLGITLVLKFSPLGPRWLRFERSALLSGLVAHPAVLRHPRLTAFVAFAIPALLVSAVLVELSGPAYLWNAGVLWVSSLFGYLVWTVVVELRAAGHRVRWWNLWLAMTIITTVFILVGGPARTRWAYCKDQLTDAVEQGVPVSDSDVGRVCWPDATERVVDGQTRLYTSFYDEEGPDAGEGLVYSPDGAIEMAGGLQLLIALPGGWYWFETGSPVHDFWLDT